MSVPSARTSSGRIALTAAWVPTGMNAGVRTVPCAVLISPSRARPSVLCSWNEKLGILKSATALGGCRDILPAAEQQAGIAVGIEPISGVDRVGIGALHDLEAGKRRDQHEQGRARQVEICHQRVDGAKPIPRR